MAITHDYVQGPPDSTGKKIDSAKLNISGNDVERDVACIGGPDSADGDQIAAVKSSAPTGTESGLVTRNIPSGTQTVSATDLTTIASAVRAEDTMSADGDKGIAPLAVRQDVPVTDTSMTGDYGFVKTDAQGRVWVNSDVLLNAFTQMNELLSSLLIEMRVQTEFLRTGLNVPDEPDTYRKDPKFLN